MTFYPNFFSLKEQRVLLSASLEKLNASENRKSRRRQRDYLASRAAPTPSSTEDLFLPDEYYTFEEGHFDGVIRRYREMHVSSWHDDVPGLDHVLARLKSVYPDEPTQTHILHLASDGEILPHVDNVEASGSWILGVSLGNMRSMRLENAEDPSDSYEMLLPSGSVYIQRDATRYRYKHSILLRGVLGGVEYGGGQRLSIMIRDRHPSTRQSNLSTNI
ncbi:2OG-FeII-Oxy-2 domain-containing protein [Phanerochaete sordida]|uniref:2OG-FeII-Oxy-2 domain-containing protein n=1 Tax=Phanerochaete sordida TaxID=48140 RepID=A0A9P3LHN8_9APHY|nr:2OG-FeII-Oxy-2 domain-containing protein [Phanerochaete sordida]